MRAIIIRTIVLASKIVEWIIVLLLSSLVIIVTINVIARYFLHIGLGWAEEFSSLLFIWTVFLGAFLGVREKAHLAITFVIKQFPENIQHLIRLIVIGLVSIFLTVVAWGGYRLVREVVRLKRVTPVLGISAAWGYVIVPVSSTLMLLEIIRILLAKEQLLK